MRSLARIALELLPTAYSTLYSSRGPVSAEKGGKKETCNVLATLWRSITTSRERWKLDDSVFARRLYRNFRLRDSSAPVRHKNSLNLFHVRHEHDIWRYESEIVQTRQKRIRREIFDELVLPQCRYVRGMHYRQSHRAHTRDLSEKKEIEETLEAAVEGASRAKLLR